VRSPGGDPDLQLVTTVLIPGFPVKSGPPRDRLPTMSHNSNFCPQFHKAVELIGKRWSGAIVREMLAGATRFSDLIHAIPDLSERMLCARLRALEEEGIVERRVLGMPMRVEYHLTVKGRDLQGVFAAVGQWADRWIGRPEE
jgi:DNA-binding HxlR family transcriptional regulator